MVILDDDRCMNDNLTKAQKITSDYYFFSVSTTIINLIRTKKESNSKETFIYFCYRTEFAQTAWLNLKITRGEEDLVPCIIQPQHYFNWPNMTHFNIVTTTIRRTRTTIISEDLSRYVIFFTILTVLCKRFIWPEPRKTALLLLVRVIT